MGVGSGGQEVAAEAQKASPLSRHHRLDGFHCVVATLSRTRNLELAFERSIETFGHMFGDAHGAVSLHVGVAADAEQTGVGAAYVPSDKKQVRKFADVVHRIF